MCGGKCNLYIGTPLRNICKSNVLLLLFCIHTLFLIWRWFDVCKSMCNKLPLHWCVVVRDIVILINATSPQSIFLIPAPSLKSNKYQKHITDASTHFPILYLSTYRTYTIYHTLLTKLDCKIYIICSNDFPLFLIYTVHNMFLCFSSLYYYTSYERCRCFIQPFYLLMVMTTISYKTLPSTSIPLNTHISLDCRILLWYEYPTI